MTFFCSFYQIGSQVRMAERSKALRSGRSPLLWAWVRIPLLTNFFFMLQSSENNGCFATVIRNEKFHCE